MIKVTACKTFEKDSLHLKTFASLGSRELGKDIRNKTEYFICFLYRRPKYPNVDKLKHDIYSKLEMDQGLSLALQGRPESSATVQNFPQTAY